MGIVYIIGAGPGAADLITVRGARLLKKADVVLYDALITNELLMLCPKAKHIFVGKRFKKHSIAQYIINRIIVKCAFKYNLVVRLKGGDPMLFGRTDEELNALKKYNIKVKVIPGITAALAAASESKQSLTKRNISRSVVLFTSSTMLKNNYLKNIPISDTLVEYMGGNNIFLTAKKLLKLGFLPTTPVIVVENCSLSNQKITRLILLDLKKKIFQFEKPVLFMIGKSLKSHY
ncbi:uroporphyrinogen-III C-methyltransferase [Candidatus Profftella armatura]|uniref:uroporphyrinogen-III C-methyltransferase n=1 Tax=Candidatus Profftella armatura TaxID=669502 RepID=S5R489_9PROT|nr:uroporphyrinogen-III C-methyltransferase [Candidatus Profftella armatura]AGS07024.1 uroporphyrin-III C-methyltransferase [Candidatus Profftella armatura]ALC96083.1 uroporphyrin-III methyltransferase [Candidatus Profftella armatura]